MENLATLWMGAAALLFPAVVVGAVPLGHVLGEVGQNHVRASPADAREGFQHHLLFVQPATGSRRLDHQVLAAHVVSSDGQSSPRPEAVDDIEIERGGFHHQHVRAFGFIQGGLALGFPRVGVVHLVGLLVSELGCGVERAAEGAVAGAGVLRRVGEDAHIRVVCCIQRTAQGGHAAIHHVAGGDDVRPGIGVAEGLTAEGGHGFIIQDAPVVRHESVVTVRVVGVQCHVCDDSESGELRLERPDGTRHQPLRVPGFAGVPRFQAVRDGGEEHHGRHAERMGLTGLLQQSVHRPPGAAGHGLDGLVLRTRVHEERVDEVGRRELRLANEVADGGRAAVAAGTDGKVQQGRKGVGGDNESQTFPCTKYFPVNRELSEKLIKGRVDTLLTRFAGEGELGDELDSLPPVTH